MKNLFYYGILTSVLLFSCSKDETAPLTSDFTVTVTGQSPNAQITITNKSTGATTYSWIFSKGADISTSSDKNPAVLNVDKAGVLSISLTASNSTENKKTTKKVTISGYNAILFYEDIEFATIPGSLEYGRFFSCSTGEILKDNEVNNENGSIIDIAYNQFYQKSTTGYFSSPNNLFDEFVIPGADSTQFINYVTNEFSVAQFDQMENDSVLNNLEIVEDDNAVYMDEEIVILFKTSDNRKGVIKTKALNLDRLLVDIKVQKY